MNFNASDGCKKSIIITCDCCDFDHIIKFSYFNDRDYFDDFVTMETLIPGETFFQRLNHGLKHAFNFKRKWVGFSSSLIKARDASNLIKFFSEFIDDITSKVVIEKSKIELSGKTIENKSYKIKFNGDRDE
jgi:hypothetical protein